MCQVAGCIIPPRHVLPNRLLQRGTNRTSHTIIRPYCTCYVQCFPSFPLPCKIYSILNFAFVC
ncbi:hypothetical protein BDR04DRAFT_45869 [Suillus decipiens]|nr:hypothetical protein BDR04DRAFT_45869 [Suillus decipiens]